MHDEGIQTDHRQRIEQEEDERPVCDALAGTTKQWRPLVLDPPICDEQEWQRF